MHILMVAAENGAIPGAKVGGIGDVIRDVPKALAAAGHETTVVIPGYQSLSNLAGAKLLRTLTVKFCNALELASLHAVETAVPVPGVTHRLIDHPVFAACGEGKIYCNDAWRPFAQDAHKFAFFCNAVCQALVTGALPMPDVIHLHDWHGAMLLFLRKHVAAYRALSDVPVVYSIHNLSIQGVRPFRNDPSSPEAWFPGCPYSRGEIVDPVHNDCINMMRMGINLADKLHVVSPTYAREILLPSDPEHGMIRGEGLERDLQAAQKQGKIVGILNGCEYPDTGARPMNIADFVRLADSTLLQWAAMESHVPAAIYIGREKLAAWSKSDRGRPFLMASIGRLSAQKVRLLEAQAETGVSALEVLLRRLGDDGLYIMLGSGETHYESFMTRMMAKHSNFTFLNGYSDELAEALYRFCDLFLMPSSYEPCGISQMLAMRAGKPCLVHEVGGLADTVKNGVNGFSFGGDSIEEQVRGMLDVFSRARRMHAREPAKWALIADAAAAARFTWEESIRDYLEKLYQPAD